MKCHACGFHGDVLSVIQKIEGFQTVSEAINYVLVNFPTTDLIPVTEIDKGDTGIGNIYLHRARNEILESMGNKVWEIIDQTGDYSLVKKFEAFHKESEKVDDINTIMEVFDINFLK